ncbi:MAG TPA: bifunctional metallophosphatase/5'-nucleotidase, partial [bacterium]|nr:bifunctional metallophosphatase/5'-nucleotidase [bacterium]
MTLAARIVPSVAALALVGATVAACAHHPRPKPVVPPARLTILGVNDFHGAIEERTVVLKTSGGTTATVHVGGAALLAAYVQRVREVNPGGTILLNAGDMWQGSMESNYFEGRPVVMLDDAIGYDATAVGNHEFDYGPAGPVALAAPTDPGETRYGALLARREEAKFPFLSANAISVSAGAPSFAATTMIERKGLKIGIVGLSTEDTPNTTQPANIVGLSFRPPAPALVAAAKDLRARGADLVLVTAHIGGDCGRNPNPADAGSCKKDEEVMRLLDAIPPGTID